MPLLVKMLKQTAVYWAPSAIDQFGKQVYAAPIQIKVRWEDVNTEVLSMEGEKTLSSARVFCNLNDLVVRGVLLQGTLAAISDYVDPYNNRDPFGTALARRIIRFSKMGDLHIRNYLRIAYVN